MIELRNLIDKALLDRTSVGNFFPSDEEEYELYVGLPKEEETFLSLEMPYTEQFGEKNSNHYFINLKQDPKAPYSPRIIFQKTTKESSLYSFFANRRIHLISLRFAI